MRKYRSISSIRTNKWRNLSQSCLRMHAVVSCGRWTVFRRFGPRRARRPDKLASELRRIILEEIMSAKFNVVMATAVAALTFSGAAGAAELKKIAEVPVPGEPLASF